MTFINLTMNAKKGKKIYRFNDFKVNRKLVEKHLQQI